MNIEKNNTPRKKILSFDLDMTLVDDRTNTIPQSALDAIHRAKENYYIVIATGRDLTQAANRFVLEQVQPDAWVHNNGTQVHVEGRRILWRLLDKDVLKRILEFALEKQICICAMIDNVEYATVPKKLEPLKSLLSEKGPVTFGPVMDLVHLPVQTLGLVGGEEDARILEQAFPELKFPLVIPGIWYDVMEKDVSKVMGMEKVLKHYHLTMEDVIAFGDSMNDYELLHAAGYAVAMGNATPKLKEIADLVTSDVDQDGIAHAMEKLHII